MSLLRQAKSPEHTPPPARRSACTSARATFQEPGSRSGTSPNPHLPERMPLMPNPYVKNVAFIDNQLVLTVQVDDYPVGEVLEISGYATQNGGAFAVFNDVKAVPERNPDGTGYMY